MIIPIGSPIHTQTPSPNARTGTLAYCYERTNTLADTRFDRLLDACAETLALQVLTRTPIITPTLHAYAHSGTLANARTDTLA